MTCRSSPFPLSFCALALLLTSTATPLMAQMTSAELWESWQSDGVVVNRRLAAESVTETADGLTLIGFTSTYTDDNVTSIGSAETLTLTDRDDGTVMVTLPEVYTLSFTFEVNPGQTGTAVMEMRNEALEIIASGTADAARYSYTADQIEISGAELSGGPPGPTPEVDLSVILRDVAASYALDGRGPDVMPFDSTASMGSVSMAARVVPPQDQDESLKASMTMRDVTLAGSGDLGAAMDMAMAAGELPEGLDLTSELSYSALRLEIDFEQPRDGFHVTLSNAGGGLALAYTDTELAYDISGRDTQMSLTGVQMPVPVEVGIGSSEVRLRLPIAPTDAPVPFEARIAYQDVTMGEAIWAMFDVASAIPRDPVTAIVDVVGEVLVTASLADLGAGSMQGPPGELRALSLNDLRIAAGGAEFTGTGDLTFAAGQTVPQPVGTLELTLSGGNALAQRLAEAGLIPADQVAMAIGMAGAFTRPGPGPDTLETTITFTEGGGISANGVPLQ